MENGMAKWLRTTLAPALLALLVFIPHEILGADERIEQIVPGKVVLHFSSGVETFYFAGNGYQDFEESPLVVRLFVRGLSIPSSVKRTLSGQLVRAIELTPKPEGAQVTLSKSSWAGGIAVSVMPNSRFITSEANVILSVTYGVKNNPQNERKNKSNREGEIGASESFEIEVDTDYPPISVSEKVEGQYEFPPFPYKYKYSDALVSLNVVNTDFRDVLMLLSEIGGVSIVLDPYWNDPPTGGRRRPGGPGGLGGGGGGAGGGDGQGQGGGGQQGGFREAGIFQIRGPISGTGTLTVNFQNVPFDLALELVLTAVNLEKIDIYPGFFDVPPAGQDVPRRLE